MPTEIDFWKRVSPEPTSGCWLWTGNGLKTGYGMIGRSTLAHRFAWELLHGPIPAGLFVLHRCDNPGCVNAESHLFLGTHAENMQDAIRKGRSYGQRIVACPKGHPYTEANTYRLTNGARYCRACHLERCRVRYEAKRATR